MSSLIISFIVANWEDILITLIGGFVVGGIFYIFGKDKFSEYYGRISSTDFMIFIFLFFVDSIFLILALGDHLGTQVYYGFIILLVYNYWVIDKLISQRKKVP